MKKTLRKATEEWVAQFSHVPASIIEKMAKADESIYAFDSDSFRLIASPRIKCSWCSTTYDGDLSLPDLIAAHDRRRGVPCDECCLDGWWNLGEPELAFPCGWGTLFAPMDPCDRRWFEANKEEVAKLGFFVFESDDYGILLGLDAAGFDFYDAYWIPLYQLRGLLWHE